MGEGVLSDGVLMGSGSLGSGHGHGLVSFVWLMIPPVRLRLRKNISTLHVSSAYGASALIVQRHCGEVWLHCSQVPANLDTTRETLQKHGV
jgi:hypothetical protein